MRRKREEERKGQKEEKRYQREQSEAKEERRYQRVNPGERSLKRVSQKACQSRFIVKGNR